VLNAVAISITSAMFITPSLFRSPVDGKESEGFGSFVGVGLGLTDDDGAGVNPQGMFQPLRAGRSSPDEVIKYVPSLQV
jgi:hypothetical protein